MDDEDPVTFEIVTPQFERACNDPPPAAPPSDWDALRDMDKQALKEIGLRPLDDFETEFLHGMEKAAKAEVQRHIDAGRSVVGTDTRPAVGSVHPFAVAEADRATHPKARWELSKSTAVRCWTRLPDDQPSATVTRAPEAKAQTRTEVIRAWCADKPVTLEVNLLWIDAMIDGRSVECWRPDCDSDGKHTNINSAGEIIDRIAQALAFRVVTHAPEAIEAEKLDGNRSDKTNVLRSESCNCDDLIEARETIARLTSERHAFAEALLDETEKLEKRIDECDSLRAQLADVMQERDEARKQLGEALSTAAHEPRKEKP